MVFSRKIWAPISDHQNDKWQNQENIDTLIELTLAL